MRATTATRCWGLAFAFGLALPVAIVRGAQSDQSGPTVAGFMRAWQQPLDTAGALEIVHLPTAIVVAGTHGAAMAFSLSDGKPVWKSAETSVLSLAVAGDRLVLGTELKVTALDTKSWQSLWSVALEEPLLKLAGSASGVIATSGAAVMHFAADDGRVVWTRPLVEPPSARPVVGGSQVYLAYGRRLAAWDVATATEQWNIPLVEPISTIVVDRSRLFAAGAPRGFYVVNPRNGWVDWQLQRAQILGAPALDDERVYLASLDNTLLGLDRGSGNRDWRAEIGGRAFSGPTLLRDVLVVPLTSGETVIVNRADGTVTRVPRTTDATTPTLDLFDAFSHSADGSTLLIISTNAAGQRRITALRRQ